MEELIKQLILGAPNLAVAIIALVWLARMFERFLTDLRADLAELKKSVDDLNDCIEKQSNIRHVSSN